MADAPETLHEGRFLALRKTPAGWEYASRVQAKGCVAILAITDDRRVVLAEQFRPSLGRPVIELPAGLAGDIPFQEDEPLLVAAQRELKEETGYEARHWTTLLEGTPSAGLTDELNTLFYAGGLIRVSEGGGTGSEDIRVHHVHENDVLTWCRDRQAAGVAVDFKIFAALHLARGVEFSRNSRLWY